MALNVKVTFKTKPSGLKEIKGVDRAVVRPGTRNVPLRWTLEDSVASSVSI